jgi:hypothetical protein
MGAVPRAKVEGQGVWLRTFVDLTPLLSVMVAVLGVLVGVHQFDVNRQAEGKRDRQLRKQFYNSQVATEKHDADLREQELHRAYWTEQIAVYRRATEAAGAIASASKLDAVKPKIAELRLLHFGAMPLLESNAVALAMKHLTDSLNQWESTGKKPEVIEINAIQLSQCCRESLLKTWSPVGLGNFSGDCPYR